jgi:hypothetical protein
MENEFMSLRSIPTMDIPRLDIAHTPGRLAKGFFAVRHKLRNLCFARIGKQYWSRHALTPPPEILSMIAGAIRGGDALAVARLGGVEATIILWAKGLPRNFWRPDLRTLFLDTAVGATNAGIRPRNRESYRTFADLAWEALDDLDLHGVWSAGYEALCLQMLRPRKCFDVEIAGPDGKNPGHWMRALQGKRVLVVGPFPNTIAKQIPRLGGVWPEMPWLAKMDFQLVAFPYLIDEGCPETWWEVYGRIGKIVECGDYDVALFGCGGLGLPLAVLAKRAGRVGIHMGGHMQLVFGIYGRRHLDHHWFREQMNESWVRPEKNEVPASAKRVEGGCYW